MLSHPLYWPMQAEIVRQRRAMDNAARIAAWVAFWSVWVVLGAASCAAVPV